MANAGPPQWGISVGVLENQPQPQDEALRMLVMQEECGGGCVWGRGGMGAWDPWDWLSPRGCSLGLVLLSCPRELIFILSPLPGI